MTGLFNYLIISRIIKLTLSLPETEVNFMLLYLYFIIVPCVFLNLFLPMVIHPSALSQQIMSVSMIPCYYKMAQRVTHTPQPLVSSRVRG